MANVINVPVGGLARSIHVQQIINWLRGVPGYEPVSLTGISHTTEYALTVANTDSISGLGLLVTNYDGTKNLLAVSHAGTTVRPNTLAQASIFKVVNSVGTTMFDITESGITGGGGSGIVTLTGTETLTNKTLTAPIINGGIFNYLDITRASAPAAPDASRVRFYVVTAENILKYQSSAASYEVVEKDATQTLAAKTLTAPTLNAPVVNTGLRINDSAEPTGGADFVFVYKLDGETVIRYKADDDTTRVLVDLNQTQTLVSKTLTSPILTTPRVDGGMRINDTAAPTGGATFAYLYKLIGETVLKYKSDNDTERTIVDTASSQTLTNKIYTAPSMTSAIITSGGLDIQGGGLTVVGTVTLPALAIADAALSANVALVNGTQTLTNKTLTSPVINSATLSQPVMSSFEDWTQGGLGSPPSSPSAGFLRMYATDNLDMRMKTPAGTVKTFLTEDTATTVVGHSFARSLLQSGNV